MKNPVDRLERPALNEKHILPSSRAEPHVRPLTAEQIASTNTPRDLRHAAKACGGDRDRLEHPAPAKHRGAWSELVATSWLLERGYEVFRNVSATGLADLVAHHFETGKTWLIDVKTCAVYCNKDGSYYVNGIKLTKEQIALGVRPLYVTHDGIVEWDTRLIAGVYERLQPIVRQRVKTGNRISSKRGAQ